MISDAERQYEIPAISITSSSCPTFVTPDQYATKSHVLHPDQGAVVRDLARR
jgi:hypothetical protein